MCLGFNFSGCRKAGVHYSKAMKFGTLARIVAMVFALAVVGTGCGGFRATPSFSPLMFFLPGLAQNKPALPEPPAPGQTATNQTVALAY